jgi:hypothetical protein
MTCSGIKSQKKLKTFQLLGGNMSNSVTIYNGTFRKLNGQTRTMRFIRKSDLPASMVNEATISNLEAKTHSEVVYDTDKRAFRQFNWKTAEGEVTETQSTFKFLSTPCGYDGFRGFRKKLPIFT